MNQQAQRPAVTPADDLLAAIRGGAKLKSVDREEKPAESAAAGGGGDVVGSLLDEIRKGAKLKRVSDRQVKEVVAPKVEENQGDKLRNALMAAVAGRRSAIASSADDDDDWD